MMEVFWLLLSERLSSEKVRVDCLEEPCSASLPDGRVAKAGGTMEVGRTGGRKAATGKFKGQLAFGQAPLACLDEREDRAETTSAIRGQRDFFLYLDVLFCYLLFERFFCCFLGGLSRECQVRAHVT